MNETGATPRLIQPNGRMLCPRCKEVFNILEFIRLAQEEGFVEETAPIYKCPPRRGGCKFLFAPTDRAVYDSMVLDREDQSR